MFGLRGERGEDSGEGAGKERGGKGEDKWKESDGHGVVEGGEGGWAVQAQKKFKGKGAA